MSDRRSPMGKVVGVDHHLEALGKFRLELEQA
jgi:hypothetical protein